MRAGSKPRAALNPLEEIVLLRVCATVAGGEDLVEVRERGMEHPVFLRGYLPYRDDVPNHDTLGDMLAAVEPGLFKACFAVWVAGVQDGLPDVIGIDAKTSRRTHNRGRGHKPLPALADASHREQGLPWTRWRDTRQATRLFV